MINNVIWKVLLMVGGIIGGIYSGSKFAEAYSSWEFYNDALIGGHLLESEESLIQGPESDAVKFGIMILIFIAMFIIGCCISTKSENNNKQSPSNSGEESTQLKGENDIKHEENN